MHRLLENRRVRLVVTYASGYSELYHLASFFHYASTLHSLLLRLLVSPAIEVENDERAEFW